MCKNRFMEEMLLKEVVKIRISVSWTSSKPIRQVDWKMNFTITWKLSSLTIVSRASFVKRRYNWRNWSFKIGNNCLMQRVKWNSVFKKQECSYDDSWYKNLSVISNKIHHNVKLGQFKYSTTSYNWRVLWDLRRVFSTTRSRKIDDNVEVYSKQKIHENSIKSLLHF